MTVNFDRFAIKAIASAGFCVSALVLSPHALATPFTTGGGYVCVEAPAGAAGPAAAGAAPCAAAAVQSSGIVPPVPLGPPPIVPPPLVPPIVPPPLVPPLVPPPVVPPVVPPVPVVPVAAAAPALAGAPLVEMSGATGKGAPTAPSGANGPAAGVPALPGPN